LQLRRDFINLFYLNICHFKTIHCTTVQTFPQFVSLRGFCLHKVPKSFTTIVGQHFEDKTDVPTFLSVTELGKTASKEEFATLPWKQRLEFCRGIAPLLDSMNANLVGPISMIDFDPKHFIYSNGTIKLYDLGLYYHGHPPCVPHTKNSLKYWQNENTVRRPDQCLYDVECVKGQCVGLNYQINFHQIKNNLIIPLLGKDFYESIPLTNGILTSAAIISSIDNALENASVQQ